MLVKSVFNFDLRIRTKIVHELRKTLSIGKKKLNM